MVTINNLSINLRSYLKEHNIENYSFEARCIIESVLELTHEQLIANQNAVVNSAQVALIQKAADKRVSGYPLQYILGEWEFFGLKFFVGEGVLIPRQDTETLVSCVINNAKVRRNPKIIDLCSGSGCVAVSVSEYVKNSSVCAVEHSPVALSYLLRNIELNKSEVEAYDGDVLNNEFCGNYSEIDIISCNPPYLTPDDLHNLQPEVRFEPVMALDGGSDGLMFYKRITSLWKTTLKNGGMIIYEIGIGQENDVSDIMTSEGFTDIKFEKDLNGIIRVVSGVYKII
ncbi:MAG: peptide chain release factor N(5)-glutamine methyltransferase [Oscillospiraceae bacterium]|nr:peptide chain release factor N(5)-glutamine methyltransferase [Oscillospiraceae bacterium]